MSQPPTTLAESKFSTSTLEMAAFFMARGVSLAGHDFDGKRVAFYFDKTPQLTDLELAYQNNGQMGCLDNKAAMEILWEIVQKHREER